MLIQFTCFGKIQLVIVMAVCFCCLNIESKTVFTTVGGEGPTDIRHLYNTKLLELALTKTIAEFGDFELAATNQNENYPRLLQQLDKGIYKNFFLKASVTDDILEKYHVIKIPVDRGVTGYRIAFTSQKNIENHCKHISFKSIKNKLSVQGIGWLDTKILEYNQFNVYGASKYEQMFRMIERKRVSYFFRGINEIYDELDKYPNMSIEPCFALKYSLPRFFITNKKNIKNAQRIEIGLKKAFKDGSYIKLWNVFFKDSIQLSNLKERQIFELENPYIKTLDNDYLKYNVVIN